MKKIGIVWFRQDLRLSDNPALHHAVQQCDEIIPLFILDDVVTLGAANRVWLYHSLRELDLSLQKKRAQLFFITGEAQQVLQALVEDYAVTHLFWNRCYDLASVTRDTHIKDTLSRQLEVRSFKALVLNEPWELLKPDKTPYRVFTPYYKAVIKQGFLSKSIASPDIISCIKQLTGAIPLSSSELSPSGLSSSELLSSELLPEHSWAEKVMSHWQTGEDAAWQQVKEFLENQVSAYQSHRDYPARDATSRLSPYLHFGEISINQLYQYCYQYAESHPAANEGVQAFLRQLIWREFAYSLLYYFPKSVDQPLKSAFQDFPWQTEYADQLRAWQKGLTGIPIVDAGMRELWQTGTMHNRVRMLVASFLTKNCLIPWQEGEQWFRDTLVDADLANNSMGWQWVAGCGVDAAPYFRIFNPVLQSRKFDKQGDYIRRWVPELASLDSQSIHEPELEQRRSCGYPDAIVDLAVTRKRALTAYKTLPRQGKHG